MRIQLNDAEMKLLEQAGISIDPAADYTEDQAFDILEKVYDAEIYHAQSADTDKAARKLAAEVAAIADKIQGQIPED